jgi:integrase
MFDISIVALNTGMRPNNLDNLKWNQILWEGRKIHVPKEDFKNGKSANFAINDTVMEILERLKKENPSAPDDYVFVWRDEFGKPRPVNRQWRNRYWNQACKEAGIEDLRFYELKHTLGTRMSVNGVDPLTIKHVFNHASLRSTERYCKSDNEANVQTLNEMAGKLNGSLEKTREK